MRLVRNCIAVGLALLVLVGLVFSLKALASRGNSQTATSRSASSQTNTQSPGSPAITPHINLSNPKLPTFTANDVRQYILHNGSPAGPLVKGAHITFEKIEFVTSSQASQLLKGEWIGLPDNAPVCYVLIHGPFKATAVHPDPEFSPKSVPIVPFADIVFDARTGNWLVWGIPDLTFSK